MGTTNIEHKFFTKDLSLNLNDVSILLYDFLDSVIPTVAPSELLEKFADNTDGLPTASLSYYNLFFSQQEDIKKLAIHLNELLTEACTYYGIDYDSHKWGLQGWFNKQSKETMWDVSPIDNNDKWHEHQDGSGAPKFHGYFCVNAEPSVTVYMVNKDPENIKVNVNKNNRAVLSEVGHPHGMGNWRVDGDRLTIAYDIIPIEDLPEKEHNSWVLLNG